ncbi:Ribonucleoside-diphosphate reductase subunit M2 [Lemmus lemmus]
MSKHLVHKTSEQRVKGIITSAVRMEQRFLLDAFAGELPGMNYSLMKQYTEFVTDLLLLDSGYNRVFRGENPFDFTENLSRQGRTNFFVKKGGYSQGREAEGNRVFFYLRY